MPDWILGPLCAILLLGFIFYAFRQGMKVKPDRNNSNFSPSDIGGGAGGSDGGGGHSS